MTEQGKGFYPPIAFSNISLIFINYTLKEKKHKETKSDSWIPSLAWLKK